MEALISVIVPVYNVAAYLPDCLESILGQDYQNLEVILIDDGSTDASGGICDTYGARDSRIRVLHQANAGAAAAKNAGLRVATGDYLSFVDSDDLLAEGAYRFMATLMEEKNADIVHCGFRDFFPDGSVEMIHRQEEILNGEAYLLRFLEDWSCPLLWDKLYRRTLFAGVFFPEGHKIDDEYFTYQGFFGAKRVACHPRTVYYYRRRKSSVMCSPEAAQQRALDRLDSRWQRWQQVTRRCPRLKKAYDLELLDALCYTLDYPDNSEKTLRLMKRQLWTYLKTPGNTFPPKRFWRSLLRLVATPKKHLHPRVAQTDTENFFP